jgi:hypothetical protein
MRPLSVAGSRTPKKATTKSVTASSEGHRILRISGRGMRF